MLSSKLCCRKSITLKHDSSTFRTDIKFLCGFLPNCLVKFICSKKGISAHLNVSDSAYLPHILCSIRQAMLWAFQAENMIYLQPEQSAPSRAHAVCLRQSEVKSSSQVPLLQVWRWESPERDMTQTVTRGPESHELQSTVTAGEGENIPNRCGDTLALLTGLSWKINNGRCFRTTHHKEALLFFLVTFLPHLERGFIVL